MMSEPNAFAELLARVRRGDAAAAAELVKTYEPAIRIAVRASLTDPKLRRQFDTVDVCQSVLGSFFVRAAAGQFDLSDPAQLVALLARMTRNKVATRARFHTQDKRDAGRVAGTDSALGGVADAARDPGSVLAGQELYDKVMAGLSAEEKELVRRRADGDDWTAIAAALGGTPEGRRKQLSRALDRVGADLGLEGDDD
jgi:DNA-directed RNA polymerase specialized sigma24 family protein